MRLKINLTTIISEVNLVVLTCDPEICNKYLFGLRYAVSVALKRQKKKEMDGKVELEPLCSDWNMGINSVGFIKNVTEMVFKNPNKRTYCLLAQGKYI